MATNPIQRRGASQIPTVDPNEEMPTLRAPAPVSGSRLPFGIPETDTTRQAVNTVMAIPAVSQGLRSAAGITSRVAQAGAATAPPSVRAAAQTGRAALQGGEVALRGASAAGTAGLASGALPMSAPTPRMPVEVPQPEPAGTPVQAPNLPQGVRREGNTFSNVPGVMTGPGVSDLQGTPNRAAIEARAADIRRANALREQGLRDRGDPDWYTTGPGAQGPAVGTTGAMTRAEEAAVQSEDFSRDILRNRLESSLRDAARGGRGSRAAARAAAAAEGALSNLEGRRSGERVAGMRAQTDERIAQGSQQTQRDVAGIQAESAMGVQRSRNQAAQAEAARDQMNRDRQFQLDVAKYGADQARQNFQQRREATNDLQARILSIVPPGPDGKPDGERAAQYMRGLNAMVGERMARLQAHIQQNPNDATAQAELTALEQRGVGVLDEADLRRFIVGMDAVREGQADQGVFFGSDTVVSDAPITGLRRREGVISDDLVSDRGDVLRARTLERPGSFLGIGGQRRRDFEILDNPAPPQGVRRPGAF